MPCLAELPLSSGETEIPQCFKCHLLSLAHFDQPINLQSFIRYQLWSLFSGISPLSLKSEILSFSCRCLKTASSPFCPSYPPSFQPKLAVYSVTGSRWHLPVSLLYVLSSTCCGLLSSQGILNSCSSLALWPSYPPVFRLRHICSMASYRRSRNLISWKRFNPVILGYLWLWALLALLKEEGYEKRKI